MSDLVTDILKREGPCLSSTVLGILVSEHKLSPEAARQRVKRRPSNIRSLDHLPFPRNAKFLFLQSEYGAPVFWRGLTKALEDSSPAYAAALAALTERGGILPRRHFPIASGAPVKQQGHMSSETILQRLIDAKLLEEFDVPGIGVCIGYARNDLAYFATQIEQMKARLIVETIMLEAVKNWARNLGLGSFHKFMIRDEGQLPRVGTFAWDLTAPSYIAPLRGKSDTGKPNPGFLACDMLLGKVITEAGVQPFLRKCATLQSLKNIGRCMAIFVANGYSPKALGAARRAGILAASPESLFGSEVAEAFVELTKILTGAANAAVDPEKFDWLFKKLGKIEGVALSLRGVLFEFVVGDLVRKLWGAQVELNSKFRESGVEVAEVDVVAVLSNRRIHFIECKGQAPHQTVDDDEVKKWLTKRIPIVREQALKHPEWKHLEMHFELWTSGILSDGAAALIKDAQQKISPNKYIVVHRNAEHIGELAKELNDETLKRVIRTHFLEHPFSADEFLGISEAPAHVPMDIASSSLSDVKVSSVLKPLEIEQV
jgi:hypothetical protein